MKLSFITVLLLANLLSGCASLETVKEAKGQGLARNYPYSYDLVFDAVLAAAKAKSLDIKETDKTGGRLLLSHGVTWLSWGERIAVFVNAITPTLTKVEIVSKPVLAPGNVPPEWQNILHTGIGIQLRLQE